MRKFFVAATFILLSTISCKKEINIFGYQQKKDLPNFGNVDLKDVSHKKNTEDSAVAIIDEYYKTIWEGGDLWGGFLVAKGDNILYENYRGFAQDNNQQPITEKTPLHVASISKTLSAMAIMKLVEAGKINLNDDVAKFFKKFPYSGVTIKNLLTQRSGLPKYEYFVDSIDPKPAELSKKFLTNQDIVNMMIRYKPPVSRDPDQGFMYCNTNFALLALILEKVTKTPFPKAMELMVFQPLKMNNTYVFQEKDTLTAARSFYNKGPKPHPLDRLDLIYGDKNIYTTPRDLLNFSRAMYAENFLRPDLMQMVFEPYSNEKPGVNNYGIGFRMKMYENGRKLTYHTGWWHGTNSVFAHLLGSKVTIIAIGNKFSKQPYSALSLASLFEEFPIEVARLQKTMGKEKDSTNTTSDSLNIGEE